MSKNCNKCGAEKPLSEFYKNKATKDGLTTHCKSCMLQYARKYNSENREARLIYLREYAAANRDRQFIRDIERHGVTLEWYLDKMREQDDSCAICRTPQGGPQYSRLAIDHDHQCCDGKYSCGVCVRGLLCVSCNDLISWHERPRPSYPANYFDECRAYLAQYKKVEHV